MNRRDFLKTSSVGLAGIALWPEALSQNSFPNCILGIQLYSVRDDMQKNPAATLQQLAKIGYRHVEHAGYANRKFYGYTARDFKNLLHQLGLQMPSGHVVLKPTDWDEARKDFTDNWKYTLEDAATVGQQFIISPWMDESLRTDYNRFMHFLDIMNRCGELCHQYHLQFGYHNHDFEFNTTLQGKRMYDLILQHTDPKLVSQQIDIGNMYGAGGRAQQIIREYPNRFLLMHVKDEIRSGGQGEMGDRYESCILGKGIIPVQQIVDEGRTIGGTRYFIVEQESYQGQTPLDCVAADYAVMKKWGY
ncbi:secreted protein [Thermoflavifilum aggregans]|uniref:Secreted protein n=1 Tax=Thermoflavifilum aggregans TaxID=454188 RepID=A0A2M9CTJ3_9BACT|nr:TIM barrel protein [Thermoflavifilum aggregans]MBX6380431.1 sugar phosphate isomerase/epimerase [Thermoflavifilum aggregans]PJJ75237.1 secreted protein [Thermoflavifilum aggregans]